MIQVINQRANGQKIIIEQENEINSVNHELEQIEAKFNQLANSINNLLTEDLKKEKPLEEKFKILYNAFIELRNKPDNNISQITEIDDKLSELEDLRNEFLKYSSIKDNLVAKHTKQIAYYKPTEEKFMKVALEVAKVMLKVKIIN
jgi:seryl-tRNA synthetase